MNVETKELMAIREYLLGSLTTDLRDEIERSLLVEDELFQEIEAAEDDLMDEYVGGVLTEPEKTRFETNFLVTPERRDRLRFANTLKAYLAKSNAPIESDAIRLPSIDHIPGPGIALRAGAALFVILLLAGGVWLYRQRTLTPGTFATLTLSPRSTTRGSNAPIKRTNLGSHNQALRVVLELPKDVERSSNYRAELFTVQGVKTTLDIVGSNSETVIVEIPAARLPPEQYQINLLASSANGIEQRVGTYSFAVE